MSMEVASSTSEDTPYLAQDDEAEYERWANMMGGADSDNTTLDPGLFGDDNLSVIP